MLNFIKIFRQLSSSPKNPRSTPINMALEQNIHRMERILANIHPEQCLADPLNPLDIPEECVREQYRFRPHTILYITYMLRGELERPTARAGALPVILQVCVALRFLDTGLPDRCGGHTAPIKDQCMPGSVALLCGHVKKDARVHPFPARE